MSRYVSWQELAARYKKAAEVADTEEAQSGFIEGAEADVDARLAVRYTVPFSPVPPAIKDIVIDLAWYKMNIEQASSKPIYEYINRRLDALVAGSASLVGSSGILESSDALPWSDMQERRTMFGVDDPVDYSVSAQWIEDTAEDRDND